MQCSVHKGCGWTQTGPFVCKPQKAHKSRNDLVGLEKKKLTLTFLYCLVTKTIFDFTICLNKFHVIFLYCLVIYLVTFKMCLTIYNYSIQYLYFLHNYVSRTGNVRVFIANFEFTGCWLLSFNWINKTNVPFK